MAGSAAGDVKNWRIVPSSSWGWDDPRGELELQFERQLDLAVGRGGVGTSERKVDEDAERQGEAPASISAGGLLHDIQLPQGDREGLCPCRCCPLVAKSS